MLPILLGLLFLARGAPRARGPVRPPGKKLTGSTVDARGTVQQSPRALLQQARRKIPDLTLEEMTAARLIASEHSSGSLQEMAAIVDAELNRATARKRSLTDHLTSGGTYGRQGGQVGTAPKRPASTRKDPRERHVQVARRVLRGQLRGIAKGAVRFFDPLAQHRAHLRWKRGESKRRHCPPAVILDRWSHDKKWGKGSCRLRERAGRHPQMWVGPIAGIDPMRLMLFRPARLDAAHRVRYLAALALIRARFPGGG